MSSKKRNGQCIHFRDLESCACNNDPDDMGECIYDDGIQRENVGVKCKYYDPYYENDRDRIVAEIKNSGVDIPENWQEQLEKLTLQNQRDLCLKKAYICSPCRSDTPEGVIVNMKAARFYMYCAQKIFRMNARAPHAYLPTVLCDKVPAERALAMQFCTRLIEAGGILLVCGNRITSGMKEEISYGARLGIEIQVFNDSLYTDVQKIVTKAGVDKKLVTLKRNAVMALRPEDLTVLLEVA